MSLSRPAAALAAGALVLSFATSSPAQGFPQGPCWDPNFGTDLMLGDDVTATGQALGFAFPMPGGGTTTTIDVCSNGYVWLGGGSGASDIDDHSETVAEFLAEPARICAAWADLTTSSSGSFPGGAVWFRAAPGRAVVTWVVREYATPNPLTAQLQLYADGSFSIAYRDLPHHTSNGMIVGVTQGNGASDPGEVDFTSRAPLLAGGGSTVYEYFDPSSSPDPRDLIDHALLFLPNGTGYDVAVLPGCAFADKELYGKGCPWPMGGSVYEFFEGAMAADTIDLTAGFTLQLTNLGSAYGVTPCPGACWENAIGTQVVWNGGTGDDSLSTQSLGFTASFAGVSTSSIDIGSNGFIWLVSGSTTITDYTPDIDDFLTDPARLAVLWTDLNNNVSSASGGGTVSFNALPGKAVITWTNVPQYSASANSTSVTVQAQLFANGDITLAYQNVNIQDVGINGDEVLVGFTKGNQSVDPLETDLSDGSPSVMPFTAVAATPFVLDLAPSTWPSIGGSASYQATGLQGSTIAVLHVGLTPLSLALDAIGMSGCTAYATPTASAPLVVSGGVGRFSLPVPSAPVLVGAKLFNQALALAPSVNSLGLIASNGLELTLGY